MVTDPTRLHQAFADELSRVGHFARQPVERAFRAVPRHAFLPGVALEEAYSDRVIVTKVEDGVPVSASSQPSFMAVMLEQLGLEPGHRVLEIGTGTGYNAALMAELVGERGHVVSVDIDAEVVTRARTCLRETGYGRVEVVCGDGGAGCPAAAPYDRIIVTVGAWDIPPALREQLRPGGRFVIPLSIRGPQRSIAFERVADVLFGVSMADCDFTTSCRGDFAGPATRLRVGTESPLWLWFDGERPVDPAAIERLVSGVYSDRPTERAATVREVFGSLYLWLALHDSRFVQLGSSATTEIPCLLGLPGKLASTAGLLDASAICVLTPGEAEPATSFADARRFALSVRGFGDDGAGVAQQLVDLVSAWDDAGRPGTAGLRVVAYPVDGVYVPAPGDFVIDKRWSRLVLRW